MNNQELYDHLINFHEKNHRGLMQDLYDASFDVTVVHDELHTETTDHTHEEDGSVSSSTKTVLGDKSITLTDGGWSYDSTAAEALQELNQIINNKQVEFKFIHNEGKVEGLLYHESKSLEIEGDNFLGAVRLLLGEIYNYLHERNNE